MGALVQDADERYKEIHAKGTLEEVPLNSCVVHRRDDHVVDVSENCPVVPLVNMR